MPKKPKEQPRPKVHYIDIIDPEHFREVTIPALSKFLNEEPRLINIISAQSPQVNLARPGCFFI